MRRVVVPAAVMLVFCSALPTPARTPPAAVPSARPSAPPHVLSASSLYARRSRRLVQSYLRLKLLEMRERDLETARKVVERKLGVGALLGETPSPSAW